MFTTKLLSRGQVIIPKEIRSRRHWETGQVFEAIDTGEGILLRPASPFLKTTLNEAVSCLTYSGKAKKIDKMEAAIKKGVTECR